MKPIKALIIEDSGIVNTLYERSLPDAIYEKQFAKDGKAGLELYQSWKPEIVLLDICLPVMSGFSVLKQIRAGFGDKKTAIIMSTSQTEKKDIIECAQYGIQGYIMKPFSQSEIAGKILEYYGNREPERAEEARSILNGLKPGDKETSSGDHSQEESVTPTETEYVEELEICLQGAQITELQRKLLNRLREKLGISAERANLLEQVVTNKKPPYTPEELEYLETLELCLESGSIGNDARKILDRRRLKLNISERRAHQLEQELMKK
jgi:DNA-binding response OmpR family regulator